MEVFGRRMRSRQARKRAAATSSTLCTTTLNSIPTNLEPNQSKLKTESPAAPNEPSHSEPVPGISEASYGTHQIGGENDVRRRESFSSERSDNGRRPSAALLGHTLAPPRLSKSPSRESRLPIPVVREENIHQGSEQLVIERQDSVVERVEERSKENGSAIFDRCKDSLFIPSSSASDVHPVVVSGVYNRPDEMILEGGVERDSALLDFGVTNSLSGEGALLASKAESPPCEEVIKIPVEPHRPPRRRGKCKDASCQVDLPDEAMCPIVIHTNNNAIREINESHPHNLQVADVVAVEPQTDSLMKLIDVERNSPKGMRRLVVRLVSARNLLETKKISRSADPFIELFIAPLGQLTPSSWDIPGTVFRSSIQWGHLSPSWLESFTIEDDKSDAQQLVLCLMDAMKSGESLLVGHCVVPLSDLPLCRRQILWLPIVYSGRVNIVLLLRFLGAYELLLCNDRRFKEQDEGEASGELFERS